MGERCIVSTTAFWCFVCFLSQFLLFGFWSFLWASIENSGGIHWHSEPLEITVCTLDSEASLTLKHSKSAECREIRSVSFHFRYDLSHKVPPSKLVVGGFGSAVSK